MFGLDICRLLVCLWLVLFALRSPEVFRIQTYFQLLLTFRRRFGCCFGLQPCPWFPWAFWFLPIWPLSPEIPVFPFVYGFSCNRKHWWRGWVAVIPYNPTVWSCQETPHCVQPHTPFLSQKELDWFIWEDTHRVWSPDILITLILCKHAGSCWNSVGEAGIWGKADKVHLGNKNPLQNPYP